MPSAETFALLLRGDGRRKSGILNPDTQKAALAMLDSFVGQYGCDAHSPSGGTLLAMLAEHDASGYLIERLLRAGADPNAFNDDGESCLELACKRCNAKTIELLLAHKADALRTDCTGRNLIAIATKNASSRTSPEQARQLIHPLARAGDDVNRTDKLGRSALFHAVAKGQQALITTLLDLGADPGVVDNEGIDLWTIARMTGKAEITQDLLAQLEALYLSQSIGESAYQEQKAKANRL